MTTPLLPSIPSESGADAKHAQRMRMVSAEIPGAWLRPAERASDSRPPQTAFFSMRAAMPEPRTTFLVLLGVLTVSTFGAWRFQLHVEEIDRRAAAPEQLVSPRGGARPRAAGTVTTATPTTVGKATTTVARPVAEVDVDAARAAPATELLEPALPLRDREPIAGEPAGRARARDLTRRAEELLRAGDADRAKALLDAAAGVDPTFADLWRALGVARARRNDVEGARIAYERYLDLLPGASDATDIQAILGSSPGAALR